MFRVLLMISSPPHSADGRRAFHLAHTMHAQGRAVAVVLLQDAVLTGIGTILVQESGGLAALVSREVPVYVSEHDLALRGFAPQDLIPGAEAVGDGRVVDLMLADSTRTLGCL